MDRYTHSQATIVRLLKLYVDFDQANELMEFIHYVQQYLIQTHERVKSTGKGFILIPFSLHNMYIQIEEILSSGWTESTYNLLKEAKT